MEDSQRNYRLLKYVILKKGIYDYVLLLIIKILCLISDFNGNMKYPLVDLLQLLCLSTYSAWSAHTANLRISPPLPANQISQISLSCDANNFNISFRMQSPFKGLVFAKDFAQECKTVGRYFSLLLYFFEQRKSTKSGNFAAQIPQKFKKILKFFSDILLR